MQDQQIKSIIESLLLISERSLNVKQVHDILGEDIDTNIIKKSFEELEEKYNQDHSGILLAKINSGYQFTSKPENSEWILKFNKAKPARLSRASLETLSILAYRQPVTRPEIDEIRGVDSGHILRGLIERSLIKILGKREEPGNPLIYGTTNEFLSFFQLSSLSDLPPLKEYTELGEESLKTLENLMPGSTSPEEAEKLNLNQEENHVTEETIPQIQPEQLPEAEI